MENVTCTLDIQFANNQYLFGDNWDLTIGIYIFQKISDSRVRITFTYSDEVTRVEEDGTTVHGHTTWSDAYIEAEENLQTLLDIICFQTSGIGLKIIPKSREIKSSQMTSNRLESTHEIELKNHGEIIDRFERTLRDKNEKLLDALRLNRLAANEENDAERIGQIWGAIERLYASDPPRILDTKEKKNEITSLIDSANTITKADKDRLKNAVNNTYKISKPSVIAEKFGLIDGEGRKIEPNEIKKMLDYWLYTRSIQNMFYILFPY